MISEDSPAAITAAGTSSPSSSKGDAVAAVVAGDTLRILDGAHSPRAVEDVTLSTTKNDAAIPKHMSSKEALPSVRQGPTRRTPQRRSSMKKPTRGCRHKPPRRAVSFNSKGPELHSIVSVEELLDYQQDALEKIWYEEDELDAAKESDFRLVANSTTAKDNTATAADSKEQQDGANEEEEEETLRGLENQTPEGSMESFMNRANAWDAVLRASFSTLDEDLAQLAEQATQRAKTTAHQRALQDQKEVLAYLKQDQSCTATKGVTADQDAAERVRNSSSSLSADSSLSSTTKGAEGGSADLSGETKDNCKAASTRVESFPLSDSLASLAQEELWENTVNDKEARSKSLVQTEEDESLKLTSVTTPKSRTEHNDEDNPKVVFRPVPEPVPDSPSRAGEDNTTETVSSPIQTNTQVSHVCPKISSSPKQGASIIPSIGNASFKEGKDDVIAPHSPFGRKGVPRLPVPCPPVRSKLHIATQEAPPGVDKDRNTRKGLPPPSMDWGSFRLPKKSNSKSSSKSGSKRHLLANKSNSKSGNKQLPAKLSTKNESKRKHAVEEPKSPSRNRVLATAPDESELSTTTAVVSNTSCNRSDTSDTAKTETSAPKSEGHRVSIKDMRKRFENNAVNQPSVKDSRRGPPSYKWRKPSAIDLGEPEGDNISQKASISEKRRGPQAYKWRKPSVVDLGPTLPKFRKEHEKGRVANKVAKSELRHTGTAANVLGRILPKEEEQETHEQTRPRGASMAPISLPVVSHKRQPPQSTSEKEVDKSQKILPGSRPVDTIVSPPTSSHRKSPVLADTISNSVVSETIQDFRDSIKSTDAVIIAVQSTAEAATKVSDASEVLAVLSPKNDVVDSYETSRKDPAIGDPPTSCTSIDAMIAAMQSAAAAANVAADAATSIANLVAGWKASNRSTSTLDPLAMAASAAATAAAAAATASAAAVSAAAAAIEATKSVDAGSPVSLNATQRIVQDQDKDIEWSPSSKDGAPRAQKTRYLSVDSSVAKPPPQTRMTTSRNSPRTSRGRNCNYRMPRNIRRSKSPYKEYKRPVKLPDRLPLQVHGKDAGDSTVQLVNKDCPTSRTSKPPKSKKRLGSPQVTVVNKDCPARPKVASESKKCPASPTATTKNNDSCGSPKSAFKSAVVAFELQSKSSISSQVSRRAMNSSKVEDPVPRRSLEEKKTRPSLEKRQSTRFFATSGKVAAVMRKFSPNLVPSRRVF